MRKNPFLLIVSLMLIVMIANVNAAYNNECWVVSNGDTIYKIDSKNGYADPKGITFSDVSQVESCEVDPKSGVVWIAVKATDEIFRFDPATADFKSIPNIRGAKSISVNPKDGTIWVGGLDVVKKIAADGSQIIATINGVSEPDVSVNSTDGSCWVTDKRGKVIRYNATGSPISAPYTMNEPVYVAVNPKSGNAWIADSQANLLVKVDPNGKELFRMKLELPTTPRVNPTDSSVWLVSGSANLIKLDQNGNKQLEVPNAGMVIISISVNPKDGSVWTADQLGSTFTGEVIKFSATGQRLIANPIPMPSYVSINHWTEN